jgi:hypothetical protein
MAKKKTVKEWKCSKCKKRYIEIVKARDCCTKKVLYE